MNPTLKSINEALIKRGIATRVERYPDSKAVVFFTYNNQTRTIMGSYSDLSSYTGKLIVDDKRISQQIAESIGISTPATQVYTSLPRAEAFLADHAKIVVKPLDAAHGDGITTAITTPQVLKKAIKRALRFSSSVLLQQHVEGTDLRVLVIDGEIAGVSERVPAQVVGDGKLTIKALILQENTNPDRGEYYEKPLNKIKLASAEKFLGRGIRAAPAEGEIVQVIGTANIGSGGHAINRTGQIPAEMAEQATHFTKNVQLFTCGVDFLYNQTEQKWYFIEANGSPSFGLHTYPKIGEPIDMAGLFIERLLRAYDRG